MAAEGGVVADWLVAVMVTDSVGVALDIDVEVVVLDSPGGTVSVEPVVAGAWAPVVVDEAGSIAGAVSSGVFGGADVETELLQAVTNAVATTPAEATRNCRRCIRAQ